MAIRPSVTDHRHVGIASVWLILAGISAFWIWGNPDDWWAEVHPLDGVPMVAAPLAVAGAIGLLPTRWLTAAGTVGLVGVGGAWMWTQVNLPVQPYGALIMLPPMYLVADATWLAALVASIGAIVAADDYRHTTRDWRIGWPGALLATAVAWAGFLGLALLRGVLVG